MTAQILAPWHKTSYDAFLADRLPRLLAQRVPLAGYHIEPASTYSCRLRILLASPAGELAVDLEVPAPDEQGIFEIEAQRYVVLPLASREQLDQAEVRCVGEQLCEFVEQRLGEAPKDLAWDANLARAWLPIDAWVRAFVLASDRLDDTNWLARYTHLRRLCIPDRKEIFHPSHIGRACPIETPEGTNIGKVVTVALGAEIRGGRVVVVDSRPEAALGIAGSMVPFLEHSDTNRTLMGTNMMRQWLPPAEPEPALVQTGNEPTEVSEFWCGRNLLTAFISWGQDTHEDGIVISTSAAARMDQGGRPLEVGDKISNRHGTKGVITRILPDGQMPHLPDGTPVELIFSWVGLHTRLNFGQQREAVASRIARAQGKPMIVPPFRAPSAADLQSQLLTAGLDSSGMVQLSSGPRNIPLEMPSLAGWIYWGKTYHLAADKIHSTVDRHRANMQSELEYLALRTVGAHELVRETFNTRATTRPGAEELAAKIAAGEPIEQAGPPSPSFAEMVRRLSAAGIQAELADGKVSFRFGLPVAGETLRLARPMPHPWASEQELTEVGLLENLPDSQGLMNLPDTRLLAEANERLRRLQEQKAPPPPPPRCWSGRRRSCESDWTLIWKPCFPSRWTCLVPSPGTRPACRERAIRSGVRITWQEASACSFPAGP